MEFTVNTFRATIRGDSLAWAWTGMDSRADYVDGTKTPVRVKVKVLQGKADEDLLNGLKAICYPLLDIMADEAVDELLEETETETETGAEEKEERGHG